MPKLYMIPGTACDWRMYLPQQEVFDVAVPEWLPPAHVKEPMADYAKRLAAAIDVSQPFFLGGVSLGGMLAQEMALHCQPKALILIATCKSSRAVFWFQRVYGNILRHLPNLLLRGMQHFTAWLVPLVPTRRAYARPLAQMMLDIPLPLLRWQIYAATHWALSASASVPTYQLHGRQDIIISCRKSGASQTMKGGHFISVTHAAEVNGFIAECMNRHA